MVIDTPHDFRTYIFSDFNILALNTLSCSLFLPLWLDVPKLYIIAEVAASALPSVRRRILCLSWLPHPSWKKSIFFAPITGREPNLKTRFVWRKNWTHVHIHSIQSCFSWCNVDHFTRFQSSITQYCNFTTKKCILLRETNPQTLRN